MNIRAVAVGDVEASEIADHIMQPWLLWLQKNNSTPQRFCEVMRKHHEHTSRADALEITAKELEEGIDNIKSLQLYGVITKLSPVDLWMSFERNEHIAPRWLITQIEADVQARFALACQSL